MTTSTTTAGAGHPRVTSQQSDRPVAHQVSGVVGPQVEGAVRHRQHAEGPSRSKMLTATYLIALVDEARFT